MSYAPIVLFVYNRLEHTKKTIQALQQNIEADKSELFIFSDAAKGEYDLETVANVRLYLASLEGFKRIEIVRRKEIFGVAKNIICGVTDIVNRKGRVIVLEDDIVTSPKFLEFMNQALGFYENYKKVWHISGWNYPILPEGLGDTFAWRLMNCWGWSTWRDRWQFFEKSVDDLIHTFDKKMQYAFNLDGVERFWNYVLYTQQGRMDTWDVFWYATIFKRGGLCINPTKTFVDNIGLDGSGIHCPAVDIQNTRQLNMSSTVTFSTELEESSIAFRRVQEYFHSLKSPFWARVKNRIRSTLKVNIK